MPISADSFAVDTSVAVAALDSGHAAHQPCLAAVREMRPVLAGHASFETLSVLTRMPGALGVDVPTAAGLIRRVFGDGCWLDGAQSNELLGRLGPVGIGGGAVYDALVGEAARINGRVLLTRDQRARRTYDLLGVTYRLVD
jgi:hypothetical protein